MDAAMYSAMIGFTQNYITPYALRMEASATQIGLLSAIPSISMVMTQLISPILVERVGSRKGFIVPVAFLNMLMWLPILLIPYIMHSKEIWWLIAFVTLCNTFDAMANAPWGSMMADLVPEAIRGRYFSLRNRISGLVALVISLITGGILAIFTNSPFAGFTIILGGALFARAFSVYFVSKMDEPPTKILKSKQTSIFKLSSTLLTTNTGRFILFNALLNFSIFIAGPFYSVYMLRDLHFSYLTYVLINSVGGLSTLVFMTFWGKRVDRAGNIKVFKFASILLSLVALMWMVSANVFYLCFVQIIVGFAWSGYALTSSIFLYEAAPEKDRIRYIALNNALVYTGCSLGSLLGGALAPLLPTLIKPSSLITLFFISGVARLAFGLILLPRISEVRHVSQVSIKELLIGSNNLFDIIKMPYIIVKNIGNIIKK
jgi:MFS family permease